MKVFNATKRHLTGSDLRRAARLFRRKFKKHATRLVARYGAEKGAALARDIRQRQERELIQQDGTTEVTANGIWLGHSRRIIVDGAVWTKGNPGLSRLPVVRV